MNIPARRPMAVPVLRYRCVCSHEFPAHKTRVTIYAETSDYWGIPSEEYVHVKRCPKCGSPAITEIQP